MTDYKRRRDYDDRQQDDIQSIEMTIFHLGDKHPSMTVEEDLLNTSRILLNEGKYFESDIIASVVACLFEMPHKIASYCNLLVALSKKDVALVTSILSSFFATFEKAISSGNWRHLVQGIHVLADLVCLNLLTRHSFRAFANGLLEQINNQPSLTESQQFICWLFLANLPYIAKAYGDVIWLDSLWTLLHNLSAQLKGQEYSTLLTFGKSISAASWEPWMSESQLPAESSHQSVEIFAFTWSDLLVSPSWSPNFEYLDLFNDTYEPDLQFAEFTKWQLSLVLRLLTDTFELNHRKLSEIILNAAPEKVGHPEKIASEYLFSQLLAQRPTSREICFEVVLMNCCRITPRFPPIMARAVFALVDRMDSLSYFQCQRLSSWFALHLTNFDFKWKWEQWEEIGGLAPSAPRRVFLQLLLEKMVRMSYLERVTESIPSWAKALLPSVPEPTFSIASDGDDSAAVLIKAVMKAFQDRSSPDYMNDLLRSDNAEKQSLARRAFIECMLKAGAKTLSHVVILIERYLPVLQILSPKGQPEIVSQFELLNTIASVWKNSNQHFHFIVERFLHYRVISVPSVIQWAIQGAAEKLCQSPDQLSEVIGSSLSYELLLSILKQAQTTPNIVKEKLGRLSLDNLETIAKLEGTLVTVQDEYYESLRLCTEGLSLLPAQLPSEHWNKSCVLWVCNGIIQEIQSQFASPQLSQVCQNIASTLQISQSTHAILGN